MSDITVILNGYKRPQFLETQLQHINKQTIKPKEIMFWQNGYEEFDSQITSKMKSAVCNANLGVWARFAYALNARTEYICIFDDDTFPGKRWLENCIDTMKTHEGLLGTIGLIYQSKNSYHPITRFGWDNPNEAVVKVDIVGHAWFFKREWLSAFWRELPPTDLTLVGEDMHFSFMIQKYLGLNTYVPPHPVNNRDLWGSLNGWNLGREANAISLVPRNINLMDSYFKELVKRGFKLINDDQI
jgi:hypothetical protein